MTVHLTLDEYQQTSFDYAFYRNKGHNFNYPKNGVVGEIGEIFEKCKKWDRDDDLVITDGQALPDNIKEDLALEIGDVLFYVAAMATELGYSLCDIAEMNLNKCRSRKERGVQKGSGDNR